MYTEFFRTLFTLYSILLADALMRAFQACSTIASWAVVTDPLNEKATKFYESFGFIALGSGRMFLPIDTIKTALI